MQIMDRVRTALAKDKRSQREIAKAAKIHHVNLSQFKSGDRKAISLDALCRLAHVLDLELTVQPRKHR